MKASSSIFFFLLILTVSVPSFSNNHCGTSKVIEHHKNLREPKPPAYLTSSTASCPAKALYDTVYSKKTEHLQIFYTLSGPHKTTLDFVESVAKNSEEAWKYHTQTMGMRAPLGHSVSYHYQQNVDENLYAIEILDLDNIRDANDQMDEPCYGCFGLVIPDEYSEKSSLFLENDFRYSSRNSVPDTLEINEEKCTYLNSSQELHNKAHDYSYVTNWDAGVRVTVFHELYHAVQVRYLNMYKFPSFWFEASASGIEEFIAPSVDDYYNYLPEITSNKGISLDEIEHSYAAGILLIYLHNFVDPKTDRYIWENFSKNPEKNFQYQLSKFTDSKKLSADSIFHDFATKLSFAGNRSQFVDSTTLICNDEPNWPKISYTPIINNGINDSIVINDLAFRFYNSGIPNLNNFVGKGSLISYQGKSASIQNFYTANEAEKMYAVAIANSQVDSIAWVFSNFNSQEVLPALVNDPTLRAYPTPWRGGNLCFTPLPRNKEFIEIRNRRGNLVSRERYTGSTYCIEESRVKSLLVPGLYHFRAGTSGKTKDFLIIY